MRRSVMLMLAAVAVAAAACDDVNARLAGIGSNSVAGGLTVSPSTTTLRVGGTVQMSTSASLAQRDLLQWSSSQPGVAAVSPTGLVTAIGPGSTTIVARLSSDTTVAGSATISVSP